MMSVAEFDASFSTQWLECKDVSESVSCALAATAGWRVLSDIPVEDFYVGGSWRTAAGWSFHPAGLGRLFKLLASPVRGAGSVFSFCDSAAYDFYRSIYHLALHRAATVSPRDLRPIIDGRDVVRWLASPAGSVISPAMAAAALSPDVFGELMPAVCLASPGAVRFVFRLAGDELAPGVCVSLDFVSCSISAVDCVWFEGRPLLRSERWLPSSTRSVGGQLTAALRTSTESSVRLFDRLDRVKIDSPGSFPVVWRRITSPRVRRFYGSFFGRTTTVRRCLLALRLDFLQSLAVASSVPVCLFRALADETWQQSGLLAEEVMWAADAAMASIRRG